MAETDLKLGIKCILSQDCWATIFTHLSIPVCKWGNSTLLSFYGGLSGRQCIILFTYKTVTMPLLQYSAPQPSSVSGTEFIHKKLIKQQTLGKQNKAWTDSCSPCLMWAASEDFSANTGDGVWLSFVHPKTAHIHIHIHKADILKSYVTFPPAAAAHLSLGDCSLYKTWSYRWENTNKHLMISPKVMLKDLTGCIVHDWGSGCSTVLGLARQGLGQRQEGFGVSLQDCFLISSGSAMHAAGAEL